MRIRRSAGRMGSFAAVLALAFAQASAGSGDRITVQLPVPARINTTAVRTILVARFVSNEHPSVDTGREAVRFVRRELVKGTTFKILDVEPPALPEQPVEDLLRNYTFWKHIAEEYGADLVVSGSLTFTSSDRSAFVDEDYISPVTGQKVRRTRFAEREEFGLDSHLWFFKGANGALLYEDSFRNRQIYDGRSNDALQIFYNLAERFVPDLLGALVPQKKAETRYVFDE